MRYQFKGIAGKWKVYDEEGNRIGSVRSSMGRKLEYQYGGKGQAYDIRRNGSEVSLEQNGAVLFSGRLWYPADKSGKPIPKSLFRPPMPEELRLERAGEAWTLRQLPNRDIEIYDHEKQVGMLKGMVMGTKTLEWSGGEPLLERGLLCFALGVYMAEDDTVYAV